MNSNWSELSSFFFTAMVIGFTQTVRTVFESDVPEGGELLSIDINVATQRLAEREHPMVFIIQSGGTAIVEPMNDIQNQFFDALFGIRVEPDAPIQEEFNLERLAATTSLSALLRDEFRPEDEECFTIRIFPVDVPGRRQLFDCNEDDTSAINFFCETTICILDNDGISLIDDCTNITNNITGPFRVAFMEKTYTVDEGVGGVNVCVHLIHPMRDILDETVNVFVIDDPSSIYIPPGALLASEYYYQSIHGSTV